MCGVVTLAWLGAVPRVTVELVLAELSAVCVCVCVCVCVGRGGGV